MDDPPADLRDKINDAADWTNQAFVIRLTATFEAFAGGRMLNTLCLPNKPGMREIHHARRLRNAAAHGEPLTTPRDINEEVQLFRPGEVPAAQCHLAIDAVLEPLWARLLLYAQSLEQDADPLPPDPAVVVASGGNNLTVQTLDGPAFSR